MVKAHATMMVLAIATVISKEMHVTVSIRPFHVSMSNLISPFLRENHSKKVSAY